MSALQGASWSLSTDQLLDRISTSRWVPLAANLGALVLLVYGLSQWTWRLLDPPVAPATGVASPVSTQPAFDPQQVISAHLFGQVQNVPVAAVNPDRLPLSSLNIVLTGVMARGPSSFAFLSVNGAPESSLQVGQEITAGAVLEAVYPDRIVLRRGGSLEGVILKDSDVTLPAGSIAPAGAPAGRPDPAGAVRSGGGGSYTVDRQALTQNLTAETLSQATVTPGAGGLVVRDVQSGSVFEKLGLRAGDVVRYINGQPVASLEDVMKIYAQLAVAPQASPIAVEVSRGGKTEVLQYRMQ